MPNDWTEEEKVAFEKLVVKGGEIDPHGLANRIELAYRLVLAFEGDELVGVGALKNPHGHRDTVAKSSKAPMSAEEFPLELGWLYVEEKARRGGLGSAIVAKLMSNVSVGVYATSHTTNIPMHSVLMRHGFVRCGKDYPSTLRKDVVLRLFQKRQV